MFMASKKKQKGMVFHQEAPSTPAAAPASNHPPARLDALTPGKASEGGMEQGTHVTSEEEDMMCKPSMYPTREVLRMSGGLPVMKHLASSNPQSDNMSPDSICKGIKVTLDNNSMWNEFFRCKTEMILTKQGSRMFPYCRFRISGLQPSRKYCLIMDIQPVDNSRYKWTGKSWQVCGKAECHVKSPPFAHPESPSAGQHWMQNPVSFYKLKLTSNTSDQEGNTVLHPMQRYLPRLHVVQTDKAAKDIKLNGPNVNTFTFPQTEFMAVTAYQNSRFAQLKVDYNPFAKGLKEDGSSSWGLKLKLNTSKDSHKDEGATTNEQHPVKKSLKSLLANHKPRSSKVVDSKPSALDDLKNSTMNKDQPAANVTEESSCSNSRPPQKLISELIREAHVSLQRCNLEQLSINNDTSHRTKQTNTKTTALKGNGQDVPKRDSMSVKTHSETSPAKGGETVVSKKVKEDRHLLNSLNCKDTIRTDCSEVNSKSSVAAGAAPSVSQNIFVVHKRKSEAQKEVNVKQHKRPAPLPLPALALFLKQHSTKSKKVKSKPESPPPALPPESLPETPVSAAASACLPSDHTNKSTGPPKDPSGDMAKPDNQASGSNGVDLHPDEMVLNVPGQAVEMTHQLSSLSCQDVGATPDLKGPRADDYKASVPDPESSGPQPTVPHGTPVLPNSDQPFCTLGISLSSTISSTLATSCTSSILSPPFDTVVPALNTPQTPTITESSTLPSDSKSPDALLPDPECSPFGFEPLSPASSLEPLPSLPASIALELDSTPSEPTPAVVPPEELPLSEDSALSVFKWHTVLPPPEPYIDTSFTTFQPTPQTLPLASVAAPLLPSQTPAHHASQTLDTTTCTPPPDPTPSFQENEQSLPFPAELSPLALQLPLSPTFSSLDGDALSPTPSIADLVHFFSTDDDLGMEVEFPNTEAVPVPCPPPSTVEANEHDLPQQVQPTPFPKPCKHKKKSWRRKVAKTDVDQKMDDSTYTSMQPSLEEVEEQLFISFTSKEALKLHVVDSAEGLGPVAETQTSPEVQQQPAEETDNEKSMDAADSLLPDCINPNNFPAKLWRLVNNLANRAICWDSCGEIIIIDQQLFEKQILSPGSITSDNADAFKTTNFSSFVRQLNLYGFRKGDPANTAPTNAITGTHHHFFNPNFKRNHPELLLNLRRLTVDNKAKLQAGLNVNCRPPSRYQRLHRGDDGRVKNMKRVEVESFEDPIAAFEKILLRDVKLMKHRQVIHPVLQEVGLKMNLLDATLSIDLQYLGVRLPIPPPGVSLEPLTQEMPPTQSVSAAFVSRTGKTTDVTQIKGWREKFTPSEASTSTTPSSKPEAAPGSEPNKKNLSAFCSDMLDEYLENEGKLIDERAASFSQPPVEPLVYELPTRSSSYVRTLDSVLKQTCSSPSSDLISGFIPPSKRPKLPPKEPKTSRRGDRKQKAPKQNKPRPEPAAAFSRGPTESSPAVSPPSEHTAPLTEAPKSKKNLLKVRPPAANAPSDLTDPPPAPPPPPTPTKRKKLKPKTWSQTLCPPRCLEDMAPLESDSELGEDSPGGGRPVMTRALLKQRDLEDGVVWEGRHRTCITRERAAIALTSLFTLSGFVSENPTAPIQLVRRRAPPCLNEFCRLGCVCSSLAHSCRIGHCGRARCMFGCSCLKQKVVLLKNLDGSDSSSSHHGSNKKRRRRRRMKMAYILKEADSVSQPAERVRTLWKRDSGDSDPDPVHVPEPASVSCSAESSSGVDTSSCARVRAYRGKKKIQKQKQKEVSKDVKSKDVTSKDTRLKSLKKRDMTLKGAKTKPSGPPPVREPVQPALSDPPPNPPVEPTSKPSKRLIILAECQWKSDADRDHMLKKLCEAMAQDRLNEPFWFQEYLVSPISQIVEESGVDRCIQYKIHISQPRLEREKPAAPQKQQQGSRRGTKPQQQVEEGAEPLEDWQQEVMEEEDPLEDWQREVMEEEEPLEDWQQEVEEGDLKEQEEVHDGREKPKTAAEKKKMVTMALPFLMGISPAGFLSANRKQLGGTDHLIQVNGKLYPLAKIQLGKMGALHPANRLAAYLTGRVGSNRKQQGGSSCSEPPQSQSSDLTSPAVSSASTNATSTGSTTGSTSTTPPRSQPSVTALSLPTTPTEAPPAAVKADQSAASNQSAGKAPEGAVPRVVTVRVYPGPKPEASQVRVVPAASGSTALTSDSVKVSLGPAAPKGSQLLMVQVPGPPGPPRPPAPASTAQRMLLQPVQGPGGVQYYRRPDGKLVQLVRISQLRPVNPNLPVQTVLPPTPLQASPITVVSQTPATTVMTSTGAGLRSFMLPRLPALLHPASGFLSQKGTCSFKILPATSNKDHVIVTKVTPPPPPKTVTSAGSSSSPSPSSSSSSSCSSSSSSSSSSLSSLQSFSLPPLPAPLHPGSGFLNQKGTCTFKILPATSNKDHVIVNNVPTPPPPKVVTSAGSFTLLQPNPVSLISLKPSAGQGAELGVKTVAVSAVLQTATTPTGTPPGSEVTPACPPPPSPDRSSPEPELACDLVDLDIICVDDEMGVVTRETVGEAKRVLDVVDLVDSSSGETDNSSDFGDESGNDEEKNSTVKINRRLHNVLERQRRGKMSQLFDGLRREVGLSDEKVSKISTLKKAVQVIQELRTAETHLKKRKRRLTKRRDKNLSTISQTSAERSQLIRRQRSPESIREPPETGSNSRAETDVMQVVDLLDETDELTDNSSDEDAVVTKTTNIITVTNEEDTVQSIAMETVEEKSRLNAAQRRLARIIRNVDSKSSVSVKKLVGDESQSAAFRALSSVMNTKNSQKHLLLKQARQEIRSLQSQMDNLKSVKICLNQQRDTYIRDISQRSGKSEQRILRKLQHLSSEQRKHERLRAANERPAARSGASAPSAAGGRASDPPPEGGGASDPPSAGGGASYPPPAGGRASAPPSAGGGTSAPPSAEGGASAPPSAEGRASAPPSAGGGTSAPPSAEGGASAPPSAEGRASAPPSAGGGTSDPLPAGGGTSDPPPAGGRASTSQAGDATPPTPSQTVADPPTTTPVPSPVQQTNSQSVLNVSKPVPAVPAVSHNIPVQTDRPRTIPNILSRSKNPPTAPPSSLLTTVEGDPPAFQALVPAEVLSLVGTALPGQQVLTLSPLMTGPMVLQSPTPGVASVTLNIPSLTNQQIHLTSLPRPLTSKIYSSSAPFVVTNLTAANFNNLLHLVQPPTSQTQHQQTQQQQTQQQQTTQQQQEKAPAAAPRPPAVSDQPSDQIKDQDWPSSQTDVTPESSSSSSPPYAQRPSSSLSSRSSATRHTGVTGAGPQQDADNESLTSLLNEIVFLNQQTLPGKPLKDFPEDSEGHAHSPWLLQLDSDSDDTITTETEEAGLNGYSETMQEGSANESAKGGVLAPPPLLQMKVGGAKMADPTSSDRAAAGGGGARQREGGVPWRPMPRLVPLGLRGAPPS